MRQGPSDRHVHEQQSERGVLEAGRGAQVVELPRQQQRGDRHRARLGDEGSEQRADRQNRHPRGAGRAAAKVRDLPQRGLGQVDDRARRRERHDDDDEERLGVVDAVVDVVRRGGPAAIDRDGHHQDHGPEAEDDLHFAEEVQQFRRDARLRRHPGRLRPFVMAVLHGVRERHEARRRKRVHDRQKEDDGRHQVERLVTGFARAASPAGPCLNDWIR